MVKKEEIFSFFTKHEVEVWELDICCIKETKIEQFSDAEGRRIWKSEEVEWATEGAVGRSGELLLFGMLVSSIAQVNRGWKGWWSLTGAGK